MCMWVSVRDLFQLFEDVIDILDPEMNLVTEDEDDYEDEDIGEEQEMQPTQVEPGVRVEEASTSADDTTVALSSWVIWH